MLIYDLKSGSLMDYGFHNPVKENEKMNEAVPKNKPVFKTRMGAVSVSVWENKGKEKDTTFKTITVQRSYKTDEGEWKNTDSMRVTDIPLLIAVLQKAWLYCYEREQEKE